MCTVSVPTATWTVTGTPARRAQHRSDRPACGGERESSASPSAAPSPVSPTAPRAAASAKRRPVSSDAPYSPSNRPAATSSLVEPRRATSASWIAAAPFITKPWT